MIILQKLLSVSTSFDFSAIFLIFDPSSVNETSTSYTAYRSFIFKIDNDKQNVDDKKWKHQKIKHRNQMYQSTPMFVNWCFVERILIWKYFLVKYEIFALSLVCGHQLNCRFSCSWYLQISERTFKFNNWGNFIKLIFGFLSEFIFSHANTFYFYLNVSS